MRKLKEMKKLKTAKNGSLVETLLKKLDEGKQLLKLRKGTEVFSQGAEADAIYFVKSGRVTITIAWAEVPEIAMAILGPGDFFGEGCLIGQSLRMNTATTAAASTIVRVEKQSMLQGLNSNPELSESFIASLIARNIDVEADICNQLFNDVEKRLAHVLLKLNRCGQSDSTPDAPDPRLSQLSHETLADLVGAKRTDIMYFLNKFRGLGLIDYNSKGAIVVRAELLVDTVLAV
jgi:CRP-like cAMP-binding protein